MGIFILGAVVGMLGNLLVAVFSREKALRLIPWFVLYISIHGFCVFLLDTPWARGSAMNMAKRLHPGWWSYFLIMAITAILAALYWKGINAAVRAGGAPTTQHELSPVDAGGGSGTSGTANIPSKQAGSQIHQSTFGPGSPAVHDVQGPVTITIDQSSGKARPATSSRTAPAHPHK